MSLDKDKNFYFSFFAKEVDNNNSNDRGKVVIYIKTNTRANIYVLKSKSGELDAPSSTNYKWKSTLGEMGGITMIEIDPTDENYCVDCTYIG